ncbi:MAG: hypothetical protein ACLGIN_03235 [Candidatus Sericytochromatia bacterium]
MATISVDTFMQNVLADEGWQSPLEGDTVESMIAFLEERLPEGAELPQPQAEHLNEALHTIALLADALKKGSLDEGRLVAGCLHILGL